jgi:acyl-Coa thioesterase superfamily protein/acyl-CoA thioesterase superfamily protein
MPDSFYRPLGAGRFASSQATAGPWSPDLQHAGPVSALIGRAFERHEPVPGTRVARVTVEILAPVPVAPLEVAVRTLRPGRRITLLEGELRHDSQPVVRATAWRIAAAPADIAPIDHTLGPPPPLPETASTVSAVSGWSGVNLNGYLSAMEWRFPGIPFTEPGPGQTWARARIPLIDGEADSPLVRTLLLADTASGIGAEIDFSKWLAINTDLTVALYRDPVGEWLHLQAHTNLNPQGSALVEGTLADHDGAIARTLQTLLVDSLPRS